MYHANSEEYRLRRKVLYESEGHDESKKHYELRRAEAELEGYLNQKRRSKMNDTELKALAERIRIPHGQSRPKSFAPEDRQALACGVLKLLEERKSPAQSRAITDIARERHRQISDEGWSSEHDDEHMRGTLAQAGTCYALRAFTDVDGLSRRPPTDWPMDWQWKPKTMPNSCKPDARRNLIIAAALVVAEIERLDRGEGSKS